MTFSKQDDPRDPKTTGGTAESGPIVDHSRAFIKHEEHVTRWDAVKRAGVTGLVLTGIEMVPDGPAGPGAIISNFVVPSLVNLMGQSKTERTLKDGRKYINGYVFEAEKKYQDRIAKLETENAELHAEIEQLQARNDALTKYIEVNELPPLPEEPETS